MTTPDESETAEVAIDTAVTERAAERAGIDESELEGTLVVLHAELIGRHAEYERDYDYVTVDGTRAYRVEDSIWEELLDEFEFEETVGAAARFAHTEQARLMFASSVSGDDHFAEDESGIVIGIDTAEQF